MIRSFKLWVNIQSLKREYAHQLIRDKSLSIHTAEGWNDFGRVHHSKYLISQGIAPTPEALAQLQRKASAIVDEAESNKPLIPPPVEIAVVPKITAEDPQIAAAADECYRIFMAAKIGLYLEDLRILSKLYRKGSDDYGSHIFSLAAVFMAGYVKGIRQERQRRKGTNLRSVVGRG